MTQRTTDLPEGRVPAGRTWQHEPAYELLLDLARIRSISATPGENELVHFLKDRMGRISYWRHIPRIFSWQRSLAMPWEGRCSSPSFPQRPPPTVR